MSYGYRYTAFARHHISSRKNSFCAGHHIQAYDQCAIFLEGKALYIAQETGIGILS
jgi:hypothetical protein